MVSSLQIEVAYLWRYFKLTPPSRYDPKPESALASVQFIYTSEIVAAL
jgi:hypothetical protein